MVCNKQCRPTPKYKNLGYNEKIVLQMSGLWKLGVLEVYVFIVRRDLCTKFNDCRSKGSEDMLIKS